MPTSGHVQAALLFCFSSMTAMPALAGQAPGRAAVVRPSQARPPAGPMARIIWLEAEPGARPQPGQAPVYREIPAADARLGDFTRWIDTEAGRFARRLVYLAWKRFGDDPVFREPVLPIVVRKDGNNAAYALSISRPGGPEAHPKLPYLILDPSPTFLGDTLLHEAGHVLQSLAMRGRRGNPGWSAFPHTTFAVSDPVTALAEGFGIHFETLWGHFGSEPAKRAYYHRLAPSFEPDKGRKAEYFAPVDDLMNFAQVWSRYQAVRDTWPAFEGHVYAGIYARSQMDPARDRARLKSPNAMLASEGVAASVMFWTATGLAQAGGAQPGGGLDQPALVEAEMTLLEAFASLPATGSATFRPDLVDLVAALVALRPQAGDIAVSRFVDVTRGVTARPAIREQWRTLYDKAIMLDLAEAKALIPQMDVARGEIVAQARRDLGSLRAGVGPVIPVRCPSSSFQLKALGEAMPVEFDLNAMSAAEYALLSSLSSDTQAGIERERARAPFASVADFTSRTGLTLQAMGLVEAERRP
jgi:hypothetical protein